MMSIDGIQRVKAGKGLQRDIRRAITAMMAQDLLDAKVDIADMAACKQCLNVAGYGQASRKALTKKARDYARKISSPSDSLVGLY